MRASLTQLSSLPVPVEPGLGIPVHGSVGGLGHPAHHVMHVLGPPDGACHDGGKYSGLVARAGHVDRRGFHLPGRTSQLLEKLR